ncbi:MAG: hypothetical protein SWH61_17820 [Thermodesulfobacteriota bacterium]|nr:hypothetical protein [Thermodesulfobacteriota bacterium]
MTPKPSRDDWVYVVVNNANSQPVFVGFDDEVSGIAYIPAFSTKEEAQDAFLSMPREPGGKYEIQAVFFGELARDALANGFLIFMLDSEGRIQEKIDPATVMVS